MMTCEVLHRVAASLRDNNNNNNNFLDNVYKHLSINVSTLDKL